MRINKVEIRKIEEKEILIKGADPDRNSNTKEVDRKTIETTKDLTKINPTRINTRTKIKEEAKEINIDSKDSKTTEGKIIKIDTRVITITEVIITRDKIIDLSIST